MLPNYLKTYSSALCQIRALTPRRADSHFSDPWSLKWSCTFSFLLILIWLYYFCGMFHIHDIHFFDALQSTKTTPKAFGNLRVFISIFQWSPKWSSCSGPCLAHQIADTNVNFNFTHFNMIFSMYWQQNMGWCISAWRTFEATKNGYKLFLKIYKNPKKWPIFMLTKPL